MDRQHRHGDDEYHPGHELGLGDGRNWSGEGLGRLQAHDLLFGTHLAETLLAYVDHSGDHAAAAAALGIKPGTMSRRLLRIQQIVGTLLRNRCVRAGTAPF
ncbi:helix-turn-helix domain-containing protein [Pseudonocardia acidicola]|uniref:PucR C-terminal helix-turn-helix domain-containing protein n=1 Tax=Pseudonocardia acidicola TaxID=2724939 RepID=A0ABX1SH79_9PSEU|nr:helix-turn-helix domain-containing protein [Pseudonocardia acidicola]NMI00929.1 hypothetical protein [Pseudonocardia acidicola]